MKVAILEYLTGGGYSERTLPTNILIEGYAILKSILCDFKEMGFNTLTLLDSRLAKYQPPLMADIIFIIESQKEFKNKLRNLLSDADISLFIAPESKKMLVNLLSLNEELGVPSLNCRKNSIVTVSNKLNLYKELEKHGLFVPDTRHATVSEGVERAQKIALDLSFPLIIKPVEGIGCNGLSILRDISDLSAAIKNIKIEAESNSYIIQKLVKGVHASVSLISDGRRAIPLTLNLQKIALYPPRRLSNYLGGIVPLDHEFKENAFKTARKAVELFGGLKGYVGVDMVLSKSGPVLLEINPRLTVSYVGLRKVANSNIAKMIVEASLNNKMPKDFKISGYAFFSKVLLPKFRMDLIKNTYSMKEVIAPPFPLDTQNYAFLASKGLSLNEAKNNFQKVKYRLLNM